MMDESIDHMELIRRNGDCDELTSGSIDYYGINKRIAYMRMFANDLLINDTH